MTGARDAVLAAWPRLAQALNSLHDTGAAPWNAHELADLLAPDVALADAAVLVALVPRASGVHVVLTRRTEDLRTHAGQVSFPGGRIETDDGGPVGAALREAQEEIGVAATLIDPLGLLDPLATISGFRVVPVVAALDPGYRATPDPREVAEVFEAPLDELLDPAGLHALALEFRGRARTVYEYRRPGPRIWGATASMLLNLRTRLENGHD